jgi:2-oxoisovalerate ferredoxin oxidoreductase beta subunit
VVVSGTAIASPVVREADILIAMNRPSLERFAGEVKQGGVILFEEKIGGVAFPPGVAAYAVPAVDLAKAAGSEKSVNTVMLGVLSALGTVGIDASHFQAALDDNFAGRQKVIDVNRVAMRRAGEWVSARPS